MLGEELTPEKDLRVLFKEEKERHEQERTALQQALKDALTSNLSVTVIPIFSPGRYDFRK